MQIIQWIQAHELEAWIIASCVILPLLRLKTPEQWVEVADKNPRLHGLMKAMRAAGFDPVGVLKGVIIFLTGKQLPSGTELPRPPRVPPSAAALLLVIGTLGLASQISGCASWADKGRHSLEASAVLVNGIDRSVASAIRTECQNAAQGPVSPERDAAVDRCLHEHHLDTAIVAIAESDRALRVAQASLDAAEDAKNEDEWRAALPCVSLALGHLLDALLDAGIPAPGALVAFVDGLPSSSCRQGG